MHPAAVTGYDQPLLAIISPATVQQESAKFRVYTLPPSSDYATPGREPHEPRAQRELNYQLLSTPSLTCLLSHTSLLVKPRGPKVTSTLTKVASLTKMTTMTTFAQFYRQQMMRRGYGWPARPPAQCQMV